MKHLLYIMCFLLPGFSSQESFEEKLAGKLREYYALHKPSMLLVNFHQPKYAAGDTAFFSVFMLHADDRSFYEGRNIVHISLTDKDSGVVHHQKVLVENGREGNQFIVPDAAPGIYKFEAFVGGRPDRSFTDDFIISGPKQFRKSTESRVGIFPEGGHLIAGVDNRIVITGQPMEAIQIIDEDQHVISTLLLDKHGFKSVYVKPEKGKQYYAAAKNSRVPFPEGEDGVAMVVTLTRPEFPMRVALQVGKEFRFRDEELYLIITSHDAVYYSGRINFHNRSTVLAMVPQRGWLPGIARASVFRENGDLLAERLFVVDNKQQISADVNLNYPSYNTRKKVVATIRLRGDENLRAVFSCSVTSQELLHSDTSSFKGSNLVYDFDHNACLDNHQALHYTDDLMVTKKWKGPGWREILSDDIVAPKSASHLRLTGSASMEGKPVPDSTLITFLLQNNVAVYHTYTKTNGYFDAPLLFFFEGTDEILYKAEYNREPLKNVRIQLDSGPVTAACRNFEMTESADSYLHFVNQKRSIDQSYRAHLVNDRVIPAPDNLNRRFEEEIFGPDATFNLSDYKIFPTMEETLREIVLLVQHRRHKNRSVVRVWFDELNVFAKGEPLYIIDGIVTEDTDYFMSLIPEQIERIKVVHSADKLRTFGSLGQNGIIFVETRIPGNAERVRRSLNSVSSTGITPEMSFYSPNHGEDNVITSRVPDLRATLYWNPVMETDENGEAVISFYTADNTGRFLIRLQGITQDGIPFSAYKTFVVEKPGVNN